MWGPSRATCLAGVLLGALALRSPTRAGAAPSTGDAVLKVVSETFKGVTLENLPDVKVSGEFSLETGNDFKFQFHTTITNRGYGIGSTITVSDGACDFRDVQMTARVTLETPSDIDNIIGRLISGDSHKGGIPLGEYKSTLNFLGSDGKVTASQSFDAKDVVTGQSATILEQMGADLKITVDEAEFYVTGMSMVIYMQGDLLGPDAGVCKTFKTSLQNIDPTLCTVEGGLAIPKYNVGKELAVWLQQNGQAVPAEIDAATGRITVGQNGQHCELKPATFKISGNAAALGASCAKGKENSDACKTEIVDSLVNAINQGLPDGYKIDRSQFSDLDVKVDPATGDITINGKLYGGAAKDPEALLDLLRKEAEKDGGKLVIGSDGTISIDGDGRGISSDLDGQCKEDEGKVAAGMCDGGALPPRPFATSPSPAGQDQASNSMRGGDGGKDVENPSMPTNTVGAVLITVACVMALTGTVVLVVYMRKRRRVQARQHVILDEDVALRDAQDPGGFDNIMVQSRAEEPVVWGDVVAVSK